MVQDTGQDGPWSDPVSGSSCILMFLSTQRACLHIHTTAHYPLVLKSPRGAQVVSNPTALLHSSGGIS